MSITLYTIPFHIIFFWTGFFTFLLKNSTDYGRITYRFSYTLRHIDRKSLITHTRYPAICTIFSFRQNDSFPKKTLNVFWIKKANCIFEELAYLYLIVLLTSFFPLLLRITQKKEPNRRNYLFELQNHAEHNTRNIQTAPYYSSGTAIMLAIFSTERDFWIISDYRNSFNNKLKNL